MDSLEHSGISFVSTDFTALSRAGTAPNPKYLAAASISSTNGNGNVSARRKSRRSKEATTTSTTTASVTVATAPAVVSPATIVTSTMEQLSFAQEPAECLPQQHQQSSHRAHSRSRAKHRSFSKQVSSNDQQQPCLQPPPPQHQLEPETVSSRQEYELRQEKPLPPSKEAAIPSSHRVHPTSATSRIRLSMQRTSTKEDQSVKHRAQQLRSGAASTTAYSSRSSNNNNNNNNNNDEDSGAGPARDPFSSRRAKYVASVAANHSTGSSAPSHAKDVLNHEWLQEQPDLPYNQITLNQKDKDSTRLPSRARQYRNLSAGSTRRYKQNDGTTAGDQPSFDQNPADHRPPSRQRHAFPTNLVDTSDLVHTSNSLHSLLASSKQLTTCQPTDVVDDDPEANQPHQHHHQQQQDKHHVNGPAPVERPPSRYMTTKRGSSNKSIAAASNSPSSEDPSDGRLPSRRYGLFQSHDPKTDGFADVDESVPPPFRIEVTTTKSYAGAATTGLTRNTKDHVSSRKRLGGGILKNTNNNNAAVDPKTAVAIKEADQRRKSLQTRQWPASNQDPLMRTLLSSSKATVGGASSVPQQLEWFKDDKIDANLFEALGNLPMDQQVDPWSYNSYEDAADNDNDEGDTERSETVYVDGLDTTTGDLYLDDMWEPESNGFNTSLGKDFLRLFAQS